MVRGIAVLAAGLGTRLRPLTDELPKPLVPIGDRPLLSHLLERFRAAAPTLPIGINASHLASSLERYRDGSPIPFELVLENRPFGTAGGIRGIRSRLPKGATLVWNGDILSNGSIANLLSAHRHVAREEFETLAGKNSRVPLATLFVLPRARGQGNVGFREDGTIIRLRQESFGDETSGGEFVGVHILEEAIDLPEEGCIVGDVYLPLLSNGARLVAKPFNAEFIDVGTKEAFLEANLAWLGRRESWKHERSRVSGSLKRSVVGEGAVVEGDLEEVVVFPSARVTSSLTRAIVTPRGILRLGQLP